MNYAFPVIMMLAFGAYAAWMMSKRIKAQAAAGPALANFFQRTGWRYHDLPPEPVEAHVQRGMQEVQHGVVPNRVTHYARIFRGLAVHHVQAYAATDDGWTLSCRWSADLPRACRAAFHVADRSLSSVGKAVREAFSSTTREWIPRYPHPVHTGIPDVDSRFVIFAHDPSQVRWLLQQNPALVGALLQQVEVDLWVGVREAVFSDPLQKNLNAAMGGTAGQMALGFDVERRMDVSIAVHDRISELLALAARATQ